MQRKFGRVIQVVYTVLSVLIVCLFAILLYDVCHKKTIKARYEKMVNYQTANVGDIVWFGRYEQDGNIANGPENIEWLVLEKKDRSLLLISRHALFSMRASAFTETDNQIKQRLNQEFFYEAFLERYHNQVNLNFVPMWREQWVTAGLTEMEDLVFCFSEAELQMFMTTQEDRHCEMTRYAQQLGEISSETVELWALRPNEDQPEMIPYVDGKGVIRYADEESTTEFGVRPVIVLWY